MVPEKEEVLRRLKIARKTKNLSYQDIVDGTEENGAAVSLSSVKRVFAEDSKACEFRYDTTLQPIIRFVLGVDGDAEEPQNLEEARAEVAGLSAVVDYKGAMIQKLESELERARELHRSELERITQAEARKVAFLREELQAARAERDAKEKTLMNYRIATVTALALFCISLILVIAYLLTDLASPHWGIFFTNAAASLPQ